MKSWKTTIIGALGAIAIALQPIIKNGLDWQKDGPQITMAIVVALLGFFAKDHDVTGGNRQQ